MKSCGFTLVELMLAVFLSSILLLGMMEAYLSLRSTYQLQQKLARMQENGRFVVFYLNYIIRNAGEAGCDGKEPINQAQAIAGYPNAELKSSWKRYLVKHVRVNTDAIIIGSCKPIDNKLQFTESAYFIDKSTIQDDAKSPVYSLYEKHALSDRSQELMDGISNMQIKYGLHKKNKALSYVTASGVSDWQSVVSVEISLIIQDKRWYTYVKLRNRN